ncbi:hypothetical protein [Herbidospora mongoliensis]|uniref:hypothetical protein n=1 Tax=Herbidospora mongoliensis TaxID=688067 RepID=UPI0009FBFA10|nr:hypothetical protein [Herbidospora mongoliensis]
MKPRIISIMQRRPVRLLAAALIGGLVGLVAYQVGQAGGRWVFVVTGTLAGIAAVAALQLYNRAARLTEVTVSVPQVSQLKFVVNNESRQVAWELFIETVTRVSTQPLDDDDGLIREAMNSLYGLFAITRDVLKASRPSVPASGDQTVEHFAITMLNHELRPFLSKWHPRLREFEKRSPDAPESSWPDNAECRTELRGIQAAMRTYALGYAELAGIRDPTGIISTSR